MTVKLVLREDKTDKNGLAQYALSLILRGCGYRASPARNACSKNGRPTSSGFGRRKKAIAERVQKRYRVLRTAGTPPTLVLIREVINPTAAVPELGFAEAMTAFIEVLRGCGYAFNKWRHYGTARNHLTTFLALERRKKIKHASC